MKWHHKEGVSETKWELPAWGRRARLGGWQRVHLSKWQDWACKQWTPPWMGAVREGNWQGSWDYSACQRDPSFILRQTVKGFYVGEGNNLHTIFITTVIFLWVVHTKLYTKYLSHLHLTIQSRFILLDILRFRVFSQIYVQDLPE